MGAEPIYCNRFHFARRIINGNSIQTSQFIYPLAFLVDLPRGWEQKGRRSFQLNATKLQLVVWYPPPGGQQHVT